MSEPIRPILTGHKSLVVGIANEDSIAYGCARAFREAGADLAVTWLNDKARSYVEPLADQLGAQIKAPLNVETPGELEAVFEAIAARWGKLDSFVHSIAYAPKDDLQGGLLDCSAEGFARAIDVSCHSFVRMARLAAPLMPDGGTMFAMSYVGANRVVANYNVMGPLKTRAASGIRDFELLLNQAAAESPLGQPVDIDDVGHACAYLATPFAHRITGGTIYIDGGANIIV